MLSRRVVAASVLFVALGAPGAAQPQGVNEAIKKGSEFLTKRHRNGLPADNLSHGIGPPALAGLALLETGSNADDAAIKSITAAVREAAYTETKTYQITLALLYLDRYGDRADLPLIQLLAVRLLAGQNANGGWGYQCLDAVSAADERRLRAGLTTTQLVSGQVLPRAEPGRAGVTGRLHPEVENYGRALLDNRRRGDAWDDNSNTQFGILGVWVARRNGVPVEAALDRIERRFIASQNRQTGGWPYSGLVGGPGTASMTCCGLLGLATAVARREENRLTAVGPPRVPDPKPAAPPPPPVQGSDPFFNPPPRPKVAPPAPKPAPPQADPAGPAVRAAFANLENVLLFEQRKRAQGRRAFDRAGGHGDGDLYFLWSLERVAVVYGLDAIGTVDWYALGAEAIVGMQNADGSWGRGRYGEDVDTAFALLFLTRANVARDLTTFVKNASGTSELRGTRAVGGGDAAVPVEPLAIVPPAPNLPTPTPKAPTAPPVPRPAPASVPPEVPAPVVGEGAAAALATGLVRAPAGGWAGELERVRDAKGGDHTTALVLAIGKLTGERKKQARDALAQRLTRMTAATLRNMLQDDSPELRRAAALACATKEDKDHVPDLIERLTDDDDAVVRAARAGVKSLTGSKFDFGPEPGSSPAQRKTAAAAWRAWWGSQMK